MEKKEIPVTGDDDQQMESTQEETKEEQIEEPTTSETPTEEEELVENVEESEEEAIEKKKEKVVVNETERLATELSEMKDKYLRLYAEFDNYRKRTLREREELVKTAGESTIKAILPAVDDFARAIKVADADNNDETISDGVRLIYGKLLKALEQRGLKPMESDNEPFDPDLHEALTKIPAPTEELKGKVIETIERGYYLKDKIIRYAKVVIGN